MKDKLNLQFLKKKGNHVTISDPKNDFKIKKGRKKRKKTAKRKLTRGLSFRQNELIRKNSKEIVELNEATQATNMTKEESSSNAMPIFKDVDYRRFNLTLKGPQYSGNKITRHLYSNHFMREQSFKMVKPQFFSDEKLSITGSKTRNNKGFAFG
jgi:hypothetical protein